MVIQNSWNRLKNGQYSENDFTLNLTILQFLVFKIWLILYSTFVVNCGLFSIFESDSETLTSDPR